MCAHFLWEHQNHNQLLNNCRQENVGSHQKKIPRVQGQRRSCNKTVGGAQPHLKSSLIPPATWGCKRNPVAPGPGERSRDRLQGLARPACGFGHLQAQGLWQQPSWGARHGAWVLLEEVTISPTLAPPGRWPTNWRTVLPQKFLH